MKAINLNLKTMLACDANLDKLDKLPFPVYVEPKIDGVRGRGAEKLIGRSMKAIPNRHLQWLYKQTMEKLALSGADFEMTLGPNPTAPDLCRATTSAVMSHEGIPDIHYWLFDFPHEKLDYSQRLQLLKDSVADCHPNVHVIPCELVHDAEELLAYEEACLAQGFEGVIIRDPAGKYKEGRSTVKEAGLLRIKRFVEEEAEVIDILEAMHNGNEAKTNELGRTERSSHQANMTPKGMVGTIRCRDLKTGKVIDVGPGTMSHADRKFYWDNQDMLLRTTIKYKKFPHGEKDKPRFPTFVTIRPVEDMP